MLVRVKTEDLCTGMFIARVDGSWMDSPFWRSKFLIEGEAQIDQLRIAGVSAVFIDPAKGCDAEPICSSEQPVQQTAVPQILKQERRVRKRILVDEFDRARALMDRSRSAVTQMFTEARMGRAVSVRDALPLVDDIAASVARNANAMITVTRLKSKNEYTFLHSVAVCALMINLAKRLGLPDTELRDIGMAGLLHDIGKMATPIEVLDKPGPLTDTELASIRAHPVEGHRLLSESPDVSPLALDVCLHHHERVDGTGYPYGLSGEKLSLYARMGAICDVYDAITSERAYKDAWSPNMALARMLEWEGHFDPDILDIFIDSIGIPPIGALVRLRSNHLAIVIDSPTLLNPCTPRVRRFYAVENAEFVAVRDVQTTADGDPILNLERGSYWFGDGWHQMRSGLTLEAAA